MAVLLCRRRRRQPPRPRGGLRETRLPWTRRSGPSLGIDGISGAAEWAGGPSGSSTGHGRIRWDGSSPSRSWTHPTPTPRLATYTQVQELTTRIRTRAKNL